jgi:hypothetical protein
VSYADNEKKFVCVLNASRPIPELMNALGQVTAGLTGRLPTDVAEFLDYTNHADGFIASISRYPYIVLKAKNGNQLAMLRKAAAEAGLSHNVFISAMVGSSAEEQMRTTQAAAGPELEYWAVALFGNADALDPLTRRFSLFRPLNAAAED